MAEANVFHELCGTATVTKHIQCIIINTERAKRVRKNTIFDWFKHCLEQNVRIVGLIVKFYKPFSQ